jgi:hypothetical protein
MKMILVSLQLLSGLLPVSRFFPFLMCFNEQDMETSCFSTKKKKKKKRNFVDINSLYLKARNVRRTSGWVPHTHFPQDSVFHFCQIIWVVRAGRRRKDTANLMMRHTECSNKIRAQRLSERKLTYRVMSFPLLLPKSLVSPFRTQPVNSLLLRAETKS